MTDRQPGTTILVAPNAFKGTLTAMEASQAMSRAVVRRGFVSMPIPVADGGEGTAEILANNLGGTVTSVKTVDALGRPVEALVADVGAGRFAVDASSACGLARLAESERDVMAASSYGLGLQARWALDHGATEILIAVGGTAFVDGGLGFGVGIGITFLDADNRPLSARPGHLVDIAAVDCSKMHPRARAVRWRLAVDVDNPLLGPQGAAHQYGPQKGAGSAEVDRLEQGLGTLARVVARRAGLDVDRFVDHAGMGAGGGLAVVATGLLGAEIESGAEMICSLLDLETKILQSRAVLTGEGQLDEQTLHGKAPFEVATMAKRAGRPVAAVVGRLKGTKACSPFDVCEEASAEGPPPHGQAAAALERATLRAIDRLGLKQPAATAGS